MSNVDPRNKAQLLDETKDSPVVMLTCEEHGYVAGNPDSKPKMDCPQCWIMFYVHLMCTTPPAQRQEKLEQLERGVRMACELEDKGKFDFKPYLKSKIAINDKLIN